MTTPENGEPVVRVHRETEPDAGDSSRARRTSIFDGQADVQDKPAVPLSPGMVRAAGLTLIVLLLIYIVMRAAAGAGPSAADAIYVSPTPVTATPSVSATPSATLSATPAPSVSVAPSVPPPPVDVPDSGELLQTWYDETGQPLLVEMGTVVQAMADDLTPLDEDALSTDCASLGAIGDEARTSRPPGSETQIAADWDDAADLAVQASDDCVDAIASDDSELLRAAVATAQEAVELARAVAAAVDAAA